MGSTLIARQGDNEVFFQVADPISGSTQHLDHNGTILTGNESRTELAGLGTSIPWWDSPLFPQT